MSQAQRNVGFTPFSRHDFYDKTYLQRLRNDVRRLDNANSTTNNAPQHMSPTVASKYQVDQSLSPRPKGSSRKRSPRPSEETNEHNNALLHPHRYPNESKTPRSLSRNRSSNSRLDGTTTPRQNIKRSITPNKQPIKSTSPSRSPSRSPNVNSSNFGRYVRLYVFLA